MIQPTRDSWLRGAAAAALLIAVLPTVARSQSLDRVKLTDKSEITGEIIALSPADVEIKDQRTGEPKRVSIDQIAFVSFGSEPDALRNARSMLLRQNPAGAVEELATIEQSELDGAADNVLAEVAFLKAAAAARQATLGSGDLAGAEKGLRDFLGKHPRSHHVFRANEILGDLLVRGGKFAEAATAYANLEKGPPAFRVRAATAKAASYYEQKKYAEAEKEYATANAIQTDPKDEASVRQKRDAEAGRARCLTRQGKPADAVKIMQDVIRAANPEDGDSLGPAYATLGDAYRAADKEQDALIAFLTVDLVYNTLPESHAEALYNLAQLWQKAKNPERSREAKQALETSYPESRWTKALAAAGNG